MTESSLNAALRHFEAAEANFVKLEAVLEEINKAIPDGVVFSENLEHEDNCRAFDTLLQSLPPIDGWKPEIELMSLDEIAQNRMDALETGEFECRVSVEQRLGEPARLLREYRYRFNRKRRELIRDALSDLIDSVDGILRTLATSLTDDRQPGERVEHPEFESLKESVAQIHTLLGSSVVRPQRWSDLHRHLHFGMIGDLHDIVKHDWPSVKAGLRESLYEKYEPIPIAIQDLGLLVKNRPRGPVATELMWESLTAEDFERLVFALISSVKSYENPEWLMRTNAPDKGRDLSVHRIHVDPLSGTIRQRVIIQCKHWLSKSVGATEIAVLREQMRIWEPPRVDVHVIATSGRFTADAVAIIEKHNQSDTALRVEPWAESHLERLLASKPSIIAEFGLR